MQGPVVIVGHNSPTFRERLVDRYTSTELCDLLEVPIEDFLDAFYELCWQNKEVLEDVQAIHTYDETATEEEEPI